MTSNKSLDFTTVRVAHIERATTAEGPFVRWALWVQGCTLGCVGCCNPHLWSTEGGVPTPVSELVSDAIGSGSEGITLVGGEPFEQAESLALLASAVRSAGMGVMTFTGYRIEKIRSNPDPNWLSLLTATDLLVDGRFEIDKLDVTRPWVGSSNQRLIHLSNRYREVAGASNRLEIRITPSGFVHLNGWPQRDLVRGIKATVRDINLFETER